MKRDHLFFEKWCSQHGMRPIQRITDVTVNGKPVGDILLADSKDPIPLSQYPPTEGNEHDMTEFYRTGFAVDRPGDKTWLAFFNDYPTDSFNDFDGESRMTKRLEEAASYAVERIELTSRAGLYDARDRDPNFDSD